MEYTTAARRQLRRLDREVADRILHFLDDRTQSPGGPYSAGKSLTGQFQNHWGYRVGDYRIICQISEETLVVQVVRVGHRGGVYR